MTCIDVTTQAELDTALTDATVTCVHVKSERGVWLTLSDNKQRAVEASGSATVRAYDSATVEASDSATVEASGSATVEATDSATVEASDSATVRAYDSATVRAYDSATVEAYDSATVRAYGSATVEASGSATVRASDSATVRAYDSATVRAGLHVAVHLHSAHATVEGGVVIDVSNLALADPSAWADHHGVDVADGKATLYKAVNDNYEAGHDYTITTYTVGSTVECRDWRDDNHCGGGLHLSPTPHQASAYQWMATKWVRIEVDLADVRPINDGGPAKAKVRTCRVVAEVDAFAREIPHVTAAAERAQTEDQL